MATSFEYNGKTISTVLTEDQDAVFIAFIDGVNYSFESKNEDFAISKAKRKIDLDNLKSRKKK